MEILGIQRGKKKNGDDFTIIHVEREFDDFESKTGEGFACENFYISKALPHLNLGDNIEIIYGKGFQGKAIITDIKIIT